MRGIFILAEIPPDYEYTLKNKGSKRVYRGLMLQLFQGFFGSKGFQ